jgi:hypothetical protein
MRKHLGTGATVFPQGDEGPGWREPRKGGEDV